MARFSERLSLPWWAWPATLAAAAFIVAELLLRGPDFKTAPLYLAAAAALAIGLWSLGRIRVRVDGAELDDPEFHVDDAHLPLRFIADAVALTPEEKREQMGTAADPLAFVVQRPWIPGAVRIDLNDPADPTPYWLISSRKPEELAAVLTARAADVSPR